jgi:hypothetical protein
MRSGSSAVKSSGRSNVPEWMIGAEHSAGYKWAFERGKADFPKRHLEAGPLFKATSYERAGWLAGWNFAHAEAVRRSQRDWSALIIL